MILKLGMKHQAIPLIGKDGDDVIDNITCELTGTESIMCLKLLIYTLKSKLNYLK